jgi:stearoyl-CoA desaturase (delta-9 desaturase)
MFVSEDESRNNWIVGLLAMGEGWHNNHHAFPRSAFHGMRWYQFDCSSYIIWTLEKVGLVWNVQRVPEERKLARLAGTVAAPAPVASAE